MLGIVAGQGALPLALAGVLDHPPVVAALEGYQPDGLAVDLGFRLETLGSLPGRLKALGVTQVCFAGGIQRPEVEPTRLDAATLPLVPRIMAALKAGDDAALREVIAIFDEAGLPAAAAHEVAPELLPPSGTLSDAGPTDQHRNDAARAAEVAGALGAADVGQSCAVHQGQVLASEGVFGTDWMLTSLRARPDRGGGVFFKAPKPGQDRRIDLPVIGPETVDHVAAAGLDGIVIEAGGVMVLNRDAVISAVNAASLFLWIREA